MKPFWVSCWENPEKGRIFGLIRRLAHPGNLDMPRGGQFRLSPPIRLPDPNRDRRVRYNAAASSTHANRLITPEEAS